MKNVSVFLFALFSIQASACLNEEIASRNPSTQGVSCLARWDGRKLLLIAEKNCSPCQQLIDRMRKEMSSPHKKNVKVVWLETDPQSCVEMSLRFSDFGEVWCANKKAVPESWEIHSTPVIFWSQGEKKYKHEGLIQSPKKLPWL